MTQIIIAVVSAIIVELIIMLINNIILTKVIDVRLKNIEQKQEKHNNFIERVYKCEFKINEIYRRNKKNIKD